MQMRETTFAAASLRAYAIADPSSSLRSSAERSNGAGPLKLAYLGSSDPLRSMPLRLRMLSANSLSARTVMPSRPSSRMAFAIAFAVFYGAGQGLTSIVRGVLPLHYFGTAGYGRTMGSLASARIIASAIAPVSVIWLNEALGPSAALGALIAVSGVAVVATLVLTRR